VIHLTDNDYRAGHKWLKSHKVVVQKCGYSLRKVTEIPDLAIKQPNEKPG
jgi:hypothetical protein